MIQRVVVMFFATFLWGWQCESLFISLSVSCRNGNGFLFVCCKSTLFTQDFEHRKCSRGKYASSLCTNSRDRVIQIEHIFFAGHTSTCTVFRRILCEAYSQFREEGRQAIRFRLPQFQLHGCRPLRSVPSSRGPAYKWVTFKKRTGHLSGRSRPLFPDGGIPNP